MKNLFTIIFICSTIFTHAQTVADFENTGLAVDTFANGVDANGGFQSGNVFLPNSYNPMFNSWSGWAISSMTDTTTPGFMNQFSAITAAGKDSSLTYAVSFAFDPVILKLENAAAGGIVEGLYVTNGTYPYLSMRDGDGIAKQFGGATGDDPDFFLLTIKKYKDGLLGMDSVNVYLADYRFSDNSEDFILDTWTYVDLTPLGNVDSLQFSLSSSDVGGFGMNTPGYFCVDNIVTADMTTNVESEVEADIFRLYPNPATNVIMVETETPGQKTIEIYDLEGRNVLQASISSLQNPIEIGHLPKGMYMVAVRDEKTRQTRLLVKN